MFNYQTHNKVVIFSAPSGSGKTTVVKHLLKTFSDHLSFSISASTRSKRPNEIDGKDYYFLSASEFKEKINNSEFVEYEEVYEGLYYGTLKSEISRIWEEGKVVIFDVDVKGGLNLKETLGETALSVFLKPPSADVLMERLKKRKTEVEHRLKERIAKANEELAYESHFDVVIINDQLQKTLDESEKLMINFLNINSKNKETKQ